MPTTLLKYPGLIKKGSKNAEAVKAIKARLNEVMLGNFFDINNPVFGDMTEKGVMEFQEMKGLEVDGEVGKITWRKLFEMEKILTGETLKKICTSLSIERANELADIFAEICPVYGMYNKEVLPEFIAELAHESIEFSAKVENLNYSAKAILKTWPSRFKTLADAEPYARNPQKLANRVYNGRMNNRPGSNDGWNFRGSGFMQLTGKDSVLPYYFFKKAGKGYNFGEIPNTPEDMVEMIRADDGWALDSACWEFAISKGLIDEAEDNDLVTITRRINGGLIGLASRQAYYKKALQYIT